MGYPALIQASRYNTYGEVTSTTQGTTITANATANAEGSTITELVASTDFAADGVIVALHFVSAGAGEMLVDLLVGSSGNERELVTDMVVSRFASEVNAVTYVFPVKIKAGTRLSGRCRSSVASLAVQMQVTIYQGGEYSSYGLHRVTTYGNDTSDSGGQQVDPGATVHTKGSWAQISASTTNRMRCMSIGIGNKGNAIHNVDGRFFLDVGVGSTGAEKVVIPDIYFTSDTASDGFHPTTFGPYPVDIKPGSRLVARAQSSDTDGTDRLFDIVIYGMD